MHASIRVSDGGNTGWLLAGRALDARDLANGAKPADKLAGLHGKIVDIAILPAM